MANKKTKETEAQTQTEAPAQTTAPAGTPAPDLNVADLKNLALVIDVASSRGAFRANEMATVGLVYNKLQAFLARVAPPAEATPQAATQQAEPVGK